MPVSALLLGLATLVAATDPTPEELTRAYRDHGGLRYTGTYLRTLTLARASWVARGEVAITANGEVRIDGEWTAPGATDPVRATWFQDASGWTLVRHEDGTYTRGTDPRTAGEDGYSFSQLALTGFDGDPFGESAAPELGTPIRFEGGDCRMVHTGRGPTVRTDWYVSVDDLLPRLAERFSKREGAETLVERLTVSKLVRGETTVTPPDLTGLEEAAGESTFEDAEATTAGEQEITDLSESLAPLIEHFASQAGKPRLIGLFAPS